MYYTNPYVKLAHHYRLAQLIKAAQGAGPGAFSPVAYLAASGLEPGTEQILKKPAVTEVLKGNAVKALEKVKGLKGKALEALKAGWGNPYIRYPSLAVGGLGGLGALGAGAYGLGLFGGGSEGSGIDPRILAGTGIGAGLGAGVGAFSGSGRKEKIRNALIGLALGAGLGAGAGYLLQ